jgi:hypothetical protein
MLAFEATADDATGVPHGVEVEQVRRFTGAEVRELVQREPGLASSDSVEALLILRWLAGAPRRLRPAAR